MSRRAATEGRSRRTEAPGRSHPLRAGRPPGRGAPPPPWRPRRASRVDLCPGLPESRSPGGDDGQATPKMRGAGGAGSMHPLAALVAPRTGPSAGRPSPPPRRAPLSPIAHTFWAARQTAVTRRPRVCALSPRNEAVPLFGPDASGLVTPQSLALRSRQPHLRARAQLFRVGGRGIRRRARLAAGPLHPHELALRILGDSPLQTVRRGTAGKTDRPLRGFCAFRPTHDPLRREVAEAGRLETSRAVRVVRRR